MPHFLLVTPLGWSKYVLLHLNMSHAIFRTWMNLDFFRMELNRSYLSAFDSRLEVRGTELGNCKDLVAIMCACNADGSHIIPTSHVGSSANPRCFRSGRYNWLKTRYRSQEDGWMDSKGFGDWINWWHSEIRKQSSDP